LNGLGAPLPFHRRSDAAGVALNGADRQTQSKGLFEFLGNQPVREIAAEPRDQSRHAPTARTTADPKELIQRSESRAARLAMIVRSADADHAAAQNDLARAPLNIPRLSTATPAPGSVSLLRVLTLAFAERLLIDQSFDGLADLLAVVLDLVEGHGLVVKVLAELSLDLL